MPFQSEKQRRYLHANHPEIAKRWEREYANGGILNHFRKKFDKGSDYGQFARRQAHNVAAGSQAMNVGGGQGNQGGEGGPPSILNPPPKGPTLAEIEAKKKAAKAKDLADIEHQAWLAHKEWVARQENKKKKVNQFEKLVNLNPVKLNSKFIQDIRQTNGKSKTFITDKSSVEDLITGDINRETNIVTPNLGTISTFMHPKGIQVLTGGDMGTIEHFPLSATQSWAVNPGKPSDDDYSDIKGHRAEVTEKQKQTIEDKMNMLNRGLIDTKTVYDNAKIFDNKGSTGFWGMGKEDPNPMTPKEFNEELINQGYKGTDFIPEVTAVGAKGGVARKNYDDGGIAALNAQLNQLPEYYLPRADGGITRLGFYVGGSHHAGSTTDKAAESAAFEKSTRNGGPKEQPHRKDILPIIPKKKTKFITKKENVPLIKKKVTPKIKTLVDDKIVKPIKKIPKILKHWSQEKINRLMKKQLTRERIEYLEDLYGKKVSSFPLEIQNLIKEGTLHTDDALQLLDKDNKFGHYKLTKKYNPTQITTGDLSGFHKMSKPKDLIDPKTGELYTNTGWELFKQDVIQKRDLHTGQGNDREFRPAVNAVPKPVSELVKGYEGWIADNPDAYPGVGTWAIIEVILPDGTPRTFSGSAEANAFAKYLESIGSEPYTVVTHETEIGKLAKGGIANHFKKRVKLQDSVESLSDVEFKTMYPDWDPEQFTREEYLQFKSETEGNGILDLGQEDETTELVSSTETDEIIPDLLAPGSAAGILAADGGRIGFFTGMREQEQKAKAASSSSGNGGYQNVHQTGAVTQTPGRRKSTTTRSDGPRPHRDTPEQIAEQKILDAGENNRIKADKFKADQIYKVLKNKDLTKEEKNKRLKWMIEEARKGYKTFSNIKNAMAVNPFLGLLVGLYEGNKSKKAQEAEIAKLEKQLDLLDDWDMKSRHHSVDTPTQILEQRILDLTQTRDRDDDTKGGEGPIPIIKPITLEVDDEYAQGYDGMSDLDRIRANQAKRSMLVEKGIIEEDIFEANSGGLANLFRVKN